MRKDLLAAGQKTAVFVPDKSVNQDTWDEGFKYTRRSKPQVWGGCNDCGLSFYSAKEFSDHIPTCEANDVNI